MLTLADVVEEERVDQPAETTMATGSSFEAQPTKEERHDGHARRGPPAPGP